MLYQNDFVNLNEIITVNMEMYYVVHNVSANRLKISLYDNFFFFTQKYIFNFY